jgi:hypothetical protein
MTSEQQDPKPPRDWGVTQPSPISSERPGWAVPVLAAGFLCSLCVGWLSFQYFASLSRGAPPSIAMAASFGMLPFLAVGLPLMLVGAFAAARPWSTRGPWLRVAVIAGVILWFFIVLQGPAVLFG